MGCHCCEVYGPSTRPRLPTIAKGGTFIIGGTLFINDAGDIEWKSDAGVSAVISPPYVAPQWDEPEHAPEEEP